MIGQINDFAGNESAFNELSAGKPEVEKTAASLLGVGGAAVPVVITGTRHSQVHFPGLREAMIGAAIYQLAEQIPADSAELRDQIRALASELHQTGAAKIIRSKPRKSGSNKKGGKK